MDIKNMTNAEEIDDLTLEEIKAIDDYYADDTNKIVFNTAEELIRWLNE